MLCPGSVEAGRSTSDGAGRGRSCEEARASCTMWSPSKLGKHGRVHRTGISRMASFSALDTGASAWWRPIATRDGSFLGIKEAILIG